MPDMNQTAPDIKVVVSTPDLSVDDKIIAILTSAMGYQPNEIATISEKNLENEITKGRRVIELVICTGNSRQKINQILSAGQTEGETKPTVITPDNVENGTEDVSADEERGIHLLEIQELLQQLPQNHESISGPVSKMTCFYDDLEKMPSLIRPENNAPSLRDKLVALFDVDGTLAQAFVMGRFAEFLSRNDLFNGLLLDIKSRQRCDNKEALKRLLTITEFLSATAYRESMAKKMKYKNIGGMPYEDLIRLLNDTYAQMLKGLKVRDVCGLGYEFSKMDTETPNILMPYAKPTIGLMKRCGITTSLLTGMPAEALGGYKEALGINERCYPLELTTAGSGGERVYTGVVANSGGLANDKSSTARLISANGNEIIMYMGDTVSDIAPMHEAMKEHDGAFGLGYIMLNPGSAEGQKLQAEILRIQSDFANRGQLTMLGKNLTIYVILKKIIQDLLWMSQMRKELSDGEPLRVSQEKMEHFLAYIMEKPLARVQELYKK